MLELAWQGLSDSYCGWARHVVLMHTQLVLRGSWRAKTLFKGSKSMCSPCKVCGCHIA